MEVRCKGIHVEHINTYFVSTNMSKIKKSSLFVPSTKTFVNSCLRNIGSDSSVTPYFWHSVTDFFVGFLPNWLQKELVFNANMGIMKKALKRQERSKKE